jgi:Ni/Co efflux regulator RcnB
MRKVVSSFMAAVVAMLALAALAAIAQEKKAAETKEARWSGTIVRSDKDGSTLTVRRRGASMEKVIHYDSSTKWTKGKDAIDASQVKDGDRVICLGTYDEKGTFHATRIDLRTP